MRIELEEYEVMIDDMKGTIWDVSKIFSSLSIKTSRSGAAGSAKFTLVENPLRQSKDFSVANGNVVRIKADGVGIFYGYVFSIERTEERLISILAYDQIRYLMSKDTYVKANVTATTVIRDNAKLAGLKVGNLTETGYAIPKFSQDGQVRLDMIQAALEETVLGNGRTYVLRDNFGKLDLIDVQNAGINLILGDGSLVYQYSLKQEIDSDTYNRVKIVQDNKKTKKRDVYIVQDSASIARWGTLQYYSKVDEGLNEAQVKQIASTVMALKNREQRSFKLTAIGDFSVTAGVKAQITIKELDINQFFLVEECTHDVDGDQHTMSLELVIYG